MSDYTTVFLDLDGTVFDFSASERASFKKAAGMYFGKRADTVYERYRDINKSLWEAFERGETTQERLKTGRFVILFSEFGLSGVDPGKVNGRYLAALTKSCILYAGAEEFIQALARRFRVVVMTNGIKSNQDGRIGRSPVKDCFYAVVTSEEAGAAKPLPGIFSYAMQAAGETDRKKCVMIGDSYTADVAGALAFGMDVVWYNPARLPPCGPPPTYDAADYKEILKILKIMNAKNMAGA